MISRDTARSKALLCALLIGVSLVFTLHEARSADPCSNERRKELCQHVYDVFQGPMRFWKIRRGSIRVFVDDGEEFFPELMQDLSGLRGYEFEIVADNKNADLVVFVGRGKASFVDYLFYLKDFFEDLEIANKYYVSLLRKPTSLHVHSKEFGPEISSCLVAVGTWTEIGTQKAQFYRLFLNGLFNFNWSVQPIPSIFKKTPELCDGSICPIDVAIVDAVSMLEVSRPITIGGVADQIWQHVKENLN